MDATRQLALQYARGKPTGRLREAHALADELRAMPDRKAAAEALALTTTMEGSTADRLDAVRAFYAFLRDDDAAIGAAAVKQNRADVEAMSRLWDRAAALQRHAVITIPGLHIAIEVAGDSIHLAINADDRSQLLLPARLDARLRAGPVPATERSAPAPADPGRPGQGGK